MGTSTTSFFTLELTRCGSVFARADIARLGWLLPSLTAGSSVRHVILAIRGFITDSIAQKRTGVAVFDEQSVGSSRVTGITTSSWGNATKVDTSAGPVNAQTLSRV
jgi:hypothetical protein